MQHVDLNVDLAEGCGNDQRLLQLVTSANVACGLHAGDFNEMRKAIRWAKENNVRVGAHPSFPDRENFGRTNMQLSDEELKACLLYQLGAIKALCEAENVPLSYVKPHGALYNQAAKEESLATLIVKTIKAFDSELKLMGLSGSLMLNVAEQQGLGTISEVFADRHYLADGSLVPRSRADAMVESDEEAINQVLQMVLNGTVHSVDGVEVAINVDSICLHGDGEHAISFADKIRQALIQRGIQLKAN
ncbi:5-oxoprolinase subunit PxpA [Avibacterium paragallinarum]|uniref:5-oxoprolinase subunit A n=1 Tax=Avibacterium paragallinarum TaxID=728 RepID=A0AAE5WJE2_AVIPA|nr:5-oxoprolinase subunit PxpA [Avibacterium paragallinarum]MEE3608984.1 5-oxoprolinase subunit PxpA [Avibacterium paragallinarum]MEE3622255.1 5-oxoprolinase subunit PxpA [Avibacterium paragallinarum]MEE3669886.1 5-oxoprolinase subunit PxpA [Avibacterium paragallinarum]MEE3681822.1 5-oxoprolinase subunit PxpA [Avibacterium paragallinarum]MEE4386160.1 5-oxoprolinase subunit PxpA [Avibacterium paragallinarum]